MREKFPVASVMQSESDGIIKPAEAGVNRQVEDVELGIVKLGISKSVTARMEYNPPGFVPHEPLIY